MDDISNDILQSIADANCADVFAYLGCHQTNSDHAVVRCYLPESDGVDIICVDTGNVLATMQRVHDAGIFAGFIPKTVERYRLRRYQGQDVIDIDDPYRFQSTIGEQDLYLFGEGTHEYAYNFLGAHLMTLDGVDGCRFSVWASVAR